MKSLNKIQLIGNLTRDPEMKYTKNGAAITRFSIATNRSWKDDAGNKTESVTYHDCVAWSKLAEICGQYLSKGKPVYVEGRIDKRPWEDKDGIKRINVEVTVNDLIMLGSGGNGERATPSTEPEPPEPTEAEEVTPEAVAGHEEPKKDPFLWEGDGEDGNDGNVPSANTPTVEPPAVEEIIDEDEVAEAMEAKKNGKKVAEEGSA